MSEFEKVCETAVEAWGESQVLKAAEEMCEFAAALLKFKVDGSDEAFDEVVKEYVDAMIVMEQMRVLYCLDKLSGQEMRKKVSRLKRLALRALEKKHE